MATRRDLLEAEAHGRRRLAAAATTGSAGSAGSAGVPAVDGERRPLRAVVVGVVLALLLLAAAAVVGVLRAPTDQDAVPAPAPRAGVRVTTVT